MMNAGNRKAFSFTFARTAAALCCVFATAAVYGAMRPTPEYLKSAVVYQIVLRNFTRDGNFKSATKMLEHVRSAGVDVVYIAPFVEMDCDMDEAGWSDRQKKSGFNSPKNPYRISNYDKIDPEYGGDADFKAFSDRAHELGMKVYMDLVYLHCGPNNVLKDMFPDAFERNPDGSVRMTRWHFPYVNFASRDVRRYLVDSMLHWIRLGCDGFRCDVGDEVPIDFWVEAVDACRKVRPDLVMINEGVKAEWLEKAFDACYAWPWSFTVRRMLVPGTTAYHLPKGDTLSEKMDGIRKYERAIPKGALMLCFMDNHDTAADDWERRFDRVLPVEAGNAAFVLMFLRRGLPLLFNGNEIADNSLSTFFAPVENVARPRKTVDWSRALQPAGQKRLSLIRALSKLRHEQSVFSEGEHEWVADGERSGIVAFVRRHAGRAVLVAANLTPVAADLSAKGVSVDASVSPIVSESFELKPDGSVSLGPWGFVAVDISAADAPTAAERLKADLLEIGQSPRFVYSSSATKSEPYDRFKREMGVAPRLNFVEFLWVAGTWLKPENYAVNRADLAAFIKREYVSHRAVPMVTWHMNNPYVPPKWRYVNPKTVGHKPNAYAPFRYRYAMDGYPVEHRWVMREIAEGTGSPCGNGRINGVGERTFPNPRAWFEWCLKDAAAFCRTLKDENGEQIPLVFRLFHECESDSFWWGEKSATCDDYIAVFRLAAEILRNELGSRNVLFAYCPNRFWSEAGEVGKSGFLARYPGDGFCDMIGFDDYELGKVYSGGRQPRTVDDTTAAVIGRARIVSRIGRERGKICGIFESGANGSVDSFYTELFKVMTAPGVDFAIAATYDGENTWPSTDTGLACMKEFFRRPEVIADR